MVFVYRSPKTGKVELYTLDNEIGDLTIDKAFCLMEEQLLVFILMDK